MPAVLIRYFTTLLGASCAAVALDLFLVPADIAPGGISGLAIIINHILPSVSVGVLILVLNVPIFVWGLRNFSRKYILHSFFGMLTMSVMTEVLSFLKPVTGDLILSSVYGGALMGLGLGTVFRSGTTTGGTDIAAQILKKHFPAFSIGRFMLMIDAFIVLLAGLVYNRWEVALYSAAALGISSYIIDLIVEGVDFAKLIYAISDKPAEIASEISSRLGHGTTVLRGSSMYSGADKAVLMCVVRKYEIGKLKKIISGIDKNAFVIVSDAREVLGNGFKEH